MSIVAAVDLRARFGVARHQGSRPTCMAFASSDLHAAARSPWQPLSCEYLYYHAHRRQGTKPEGGIALRRALEVVARDGQPVESVWPYLKQLPPDLGAWVPPSPIGTLFRGVGDELDGDAAMIRSELDAGRPVVLVTSISDAFYSPDRDGVVDSAEPPDASRVHAVVAVGHGNSGSRQYTLVRNSWGPNWGDAGYAWLSDRYLAPRLQGFAIITQVL